MEISIETLPNQHVLASARAFYNAAKMLHDEKFINVEIPVLVNSAFALELYLKSFNSKKIFQNGKLNNEGIAIYEEVVNKPNTTGHNLADLYSAISDEIKQVIKSEYLENESFENGIIEFNNIFIEYRYSFERRNKGVNLTKMFSILKTLENVAVALEKKAKSNKRGRMD